jgi:hypothetical protein
MAAVQAVEGVDLRRCMDDVADHERPVPAPDSSLHAKEAGELQRLGRDIVEVYCLTYEVEAKAFAVELGGRSGFTYDRKPYFRPSVFEVARMQVELIRLWVEKAYDV